MLPVIRSSPSAVGRNAVAGGGLILGDEVTIQMAISAVEQ